MSDLDLIVSGAPVPQGRCRVPRFGKPYYPKSTQDYRKTLVEAVRSCWKMPPLTRAGLAVSAYGMRANGDLSNLLKAVEDALVEAKALEGDTWLHLPVIHLFGHHASKENRRVEICLSSLN